MAKIKIPQSRFERDNPDLRQALSNVIKQLETNDTRSLLPVKDLLDQLRELEKLLGVAVQKGFNVTETEHNSIQDFLKNIDLMIPPVSKITQALFKEMQTLRRLHYYIKEKFELALRVSTPPLPGRTTRTISSVPGEESKQTKKLHPSDDETERKSEEIRTALNRFANYVFAGTATADTKASNLLKGIEKKVKVVYETDIQKKYFEEVMLLFDEQIKEMEYTAGKSLAEYKEKLLEEFTKISPDKIYLLTEFSFRFLLKIIAPDHPVNGLTGRNTDNIKLQADNSSLKDNVGTSGLKLLDALVPPDSDAVKEDKEEKVSTRFSAPKVKLERVYDPSLKSNRSFNRLAQLILAEDANDQEIRDILDTTSQYQEKDFHTVLAAFDAYIENPDNKRSKEENDLLKQYRDKLAEEYDNTSDDLFQLTEFSYRLLLNIMHPDNPANDRTGQNTLAICHQAYLYSWSDTIGKAGLQILFKLTSKSEKTLDEFLDRVLAGKTNGDDKKTRSLLKMYPGTQLIDFYAVMSKFDDLISNVSADKQHKLKHFKEEATKKAEEYVHTDKSDELYLLTEFSYRLLIATKQPDHPANTPEGRNTRTINLLSRSNRLDESIRKLGRAIIINSQPALIAEEKAAESKESANNFGVGELKKSENQTLKMIGQLLDSAAALSSFIKTHSKQLSHEDMTSITTAVTNTKKARETLIQQYEQQQGPDALLQLKSYLEKFNPEEFTEKLLKTTIELVPQTEPAVKALLDQEVNRAQAVIDATQLLLTASLKLPEEEKADPTASHGRTPELSHEPVKQPNFFKRNWKPLALIAGTLVVGAAIFFTAGAAGLLGVGVAAGIAAGKLGAIGALSAGALAAGVTVSTLLGYSLTHMAVMIGTDLAELKSAKPDVAQKPSLDSPQDVRRITLNKSLEEPKAPKKLLRSSTAKHIAPQMPIERPGIAPPRAAPASFSEKAEAEARRKLQEVAASPAPAANAVDAATPERSEAERGRSSSFSRSRTSSTD